MKAAVLLGSACALALAGWWSSAREPVPPARAVAATAAIGPQQPAPGRVASSPPASPSPGLRVGPLPASLQDTEVDGAWRADARGQLVVDRALRRRFDYWLSAVGELPADEIGARVQDAAARELPPTAVAQLQALWARYVLLQEQRWQHMARHAEPATWRPALEERQSTRRQLLGREAADAFYAEEEQALWQEVVAWEAGRPSPSLAGAAATLPEHPQASQRVAEVDAQWLQWERRLAEARGELARLRAAPELSEPQREQATQAWLAQRFGTAEQPRVRALLGLSPPPGT